MNNPGKFEACNDQILGEYLHGLSLDGCLDNELGDVEDFGWYGLLIDIGENKKSYIISEDNNGFFTYQEYLDREVCIENWQKLENEYDTFESENDNQENN
jgi:hypothetical protein